MKTKYVSIICLLAILAMLLLPAMAQTDTNSPPVPPIPGDSELVSLIKQLSGGDGKVSAVVSYLGVLAVFSALAGRKLERWIQDKINAIAESSTLDDDEYLRQLFSKPWYKFVAFLSGFTPFRLKTLSDLERAIRLQKEAILASQK